MPENKNDDVLNDLLSGNDEDVRWISEDLEHIVYRSEEERMKLKDEPDGPDLGELEQMRDSSQKLTLKSHDVGDVRQPNEQLTPIRGLGVTYGDNDFKVIDVGPRGLTIRFGSEASFGVGQPLKGVHLDFKGRKMPLDAEVLFVAKDAEGRQLCGLRLLLADKEKESRLLDLMIKYKDQIRKGNAPKPPAATE